jgi:hypothetical protein
MKRIKIVNISKVVTVGKWSTDFAASCKKSDKQVKEETVFFSRKN